MDTIVPGGVQGYDRYAYVNNSPVNFTDPSGHRECEPGTDCRPPGSISTGSATIHINNKPPTDPGNKPEHPHGGGGGGGSGVDDTGPITDAILNLPFSSDFYSGISTGLDVTAWLLDVYSVGVVTYGSLFGAGIALPFIPGVLQKFPWYQA